MLKTDEEAVICDLAETYNIYDYKSMPPIKVAVFCVGLRSDSRIKMKMNNLKVPNETLMLSIIMDKVNLLWWAQTKDAQKNKNRPESHTIKLIDIDSYKSQDYMTFASGKDFDDELNRLRGGL